jgi:hypothetical protein
VVDRPRHVGQQFRVAVAVARDKRADLNARGRLGPGAEHRPALEVLALWLAIQGIEVIPVKDDVGAELLRLGGGAADRLVISVLRLQLQAHAHGLRGSCHEVLA